MGQTTEQLLTGYYAAWQPDNADSILANFTEDAMFEDLAFEASFSGHAQIRSFIELTYSGIPDFKVEPTSIVAGVDCAAAQWTMSGTHAGDLPGLPATGKVFSVRASSVIALRDQLIRSIHDYWNPETFKRCVGLA